MTQKDIEELAIGRAEEILSSWWYEDRWEFAEEHGLSDEDLEKVLEVPLDITVIKDVSK